MMINKLKIPLIIITAMILSAILIWDLTSQRHINLSSQKDRSIKPINSSAIKYQKIPQASMLNSGTMSKQLSVSPTSVKDKLLDLSSRFIQEISLKNEERSLSLWYEMEQLVSGNKQSISLILELLTDPILSENQKLVLSALYPSDTESLEILIKGLMTAKDLSTFRALLDAMGKEIWLRDPISWIESSTISGRLTSYLWLSDDQTPNLFDRITDQSLKQWILDYVKNPSNDYQLRLDMLEFIATGVLTHDISEFLKNKIQTYDHDFIVMKSAAILIRKGTNADRDFIINYIINTQDAKRVDSVLVAVRYTLGNLEPPYYFRLYHMMLSNALKVVSINDTTDHGAKALSVDCLWILAENKDPQVLSLCLQYAHEKQIHETARFWMIGALGNYKDYPGVEDVLKVIISDKSNDIEIIEQGIRHLSSIGTVQTAGWLEEQLNYTQDKRVKKAINDAINLLR